MTIYHIYTDGACIGPPEARVGGYGVFWDGVSETPLRKTPCATSLPLPRDEPQTNQRAELRAIICALEQIVNLPYDGSIAECTIFTDSRYSIDCITKWRANWQRNGWLTAGKQPVKNRDLIEKAGMLWDCLVESHDHDVTLEWVRVSTGASTRQADTDIAGKGSRWIDWKHRGRSTRYAGCRRLCC